MNRIIPFILAFIAVIPAWSQDGEALFKTYCTACHTVGGGKRVGPDLMNISQQHDVDWLMAFIQSSTKMIRSGDSAAVAVYREYNKIPMPDQPLNDQQVKAIIGYIDSKSQSPQPSGAVLQAPPDLLAETSFANTDQGRQLFSGRKPFTNHGPSCIACHLVQDDYVFSSGTLAKELTGSFALMGSAGVAAILMSPPFPVMAKAYEKHPLTNEEVRDLTAYLKSVGDQRIYQHPRNYAALFGFTGFFFFILALITIQILYHNRKKLPVNHDIYRRQSINNQ